MEYVKERNYKYKTIYFYAVSNYKRRLRMEGWNGEIEWVDGIEGDRRVVKNCLIE